MALTMTLTRSDYTEAITEDLKSIPENYLPDVSNIVNSFKKSVTHLPPLTKQQQQALAIGMEQADTGKFVSTKQVADVFGRYED